MELSLIARFVDAFVGGFFKTMKERLIDGGLVVLTLIFWLRSGKFSAHLWENVGPWIWLLCVVAVRHAYKASRQLLDEVKSEEHRSGKRSLVLLEYGQPFELPRSEVPAYRLRIWALMLTVILFCAAMSYLVWRVPAVAELSPPAVETKEPRLSVFVKCDLKALPFAIQPNSYIRIIPVNERIMRANHTGSQDVSNQTDKMDYWPPKQLITLSEKQHNTGVFGYRCDVSNNGEVNLSDAMLPMEFLFGEKKKDQDTGVPYMAIAAPLNVGTTMSLYFANECPINVVATAAYEGTVLVASEEKRRRVRLNYPKRNVLDQIMQFFPSSVDWTGNQCNR